MRRRLAYIMGPNYSGSTLLTLLMANHPQIATIGEIKATSMGDIDTYHCSCGQLITTCPFWNNLAQIMQEKGKTFTVRNFQTHFRSPEHFLTDRLLRASLRNPFLEFFRETCFNLLPVAKNIRKQIIQQNRQLIEAICSIQKSETFLDDSKEPIRLKYLLSSNFWDIFVIRLVRDGRGVTNSYMRHNNVAMTKAAREWTHTENECNRMAKQLDTRRYLSVHYEELCDNPRETINRICYFLELQPISNEQLHRDKHILGNQMRIESLQEIRIDEKWKHTLSTSDLNVFSSIAGKINQLHGYN